MTKNPKIKARADKFEHFLVHLAELDAMASNKVKPASKLNPVKPAAPADLDDRPSRVNRNINAAITLALLVLIVAVTCKALL